MIVYAVEHYHDLVTYNDTALFFTYEKALAYWEQLFEEVASEFFPHGVPPKEQIQKMLDEPLEELYAWDVEDKYKLIDGFPNGLHSDRSYLHLTEYEIH